VTKALARLVCLAWRWVGISVPQVYQCLLMLIHKQAHLPATTSQAVSVNT